jgi:HAD superfamily phosphatase (TIGR01668 family)
VEKTEDSGDVPGKPRLMLRPERLAARLSAVPIAELCDHGVRGIILDLDNTLVGYGRDHVEAEDLAWIAKARRGGLSFVLLSNNTTGRVRRVGAELSMPAIDCALKPLPHGFKRALGLLGLPRDQVRAIGDQLFTDVLGAGFAGVRCILVEPLVTSDWPGTRILRSLERLVLPHRRAS